MGGDFYGWSCNDNDSVQPTLVPENSDSLQNSFSVGSWFIVVHLRPDHITNTCRPTTDGSSSTVQSISITLLQRIATLVHVLQNVALCQIGLIQLVNFSL